MKPDVVVFFDSTRQAWVMVSRPAYLEYVLTADQYEYIRTVYLFDGPVGDSLTKVLARMGTNTQGKTARDIFILRPKGSMNILKASWAVTNYCPYHCAICVMKGIKEQELPCQQKIKVLKKLEKLGCTWLQLTGGEPTSSPDFCNLYEEAYDLGFLIKIQTNGFYFSLNTRLKQLIQEKPPYQITLSMYGASARTYNCYTGISGSYACFLAGLKILKSSGINTHINIIITQKNEREIDEMINLCQQFGFSWFVSGSITPTFSGSPTPLHYAVDCPDVVQSINPPADKTPEQTCQAGKYFIHITSSGQVLPCQTARVMCRGFNIFSFFIKYKLKKQTKSINKPLVQCASCICSICNPLRLLYFQAGLKPKGCSNS
ncbi:MAG TPA: radical SAM protein [bacterium]|nr:radical SAM protein [bacterium]